MHVFFVLNGLSLSSLLNKEVQETHRLFDLFVNFINREKQHAYSTTSRPVSPVAPGLDNFSDRPGSPSYVEMVTGSRSRSPSPADSVSGAIGERLNSLSIKKDESSLVRGDAISLSTAEDDVVMEDAPLNNARRAISDLMRN
ncbi:hypothetical protein G6F63_012928 [Rhizopus arrhizus]|nr:hypothetical protein G6F63_012928 [Rhizopus arrhizus]